MALDNYASAVISMAGMTFDSIGGLYLAYDLLGGERGPLSQLTRCATYSLIAVLCYSLTMNFKFALICGVGMGTIIGIQLHLLGAKKAPTRKQHFFIALARMLVIGFGTSMIMAKPAACVLGLGAFFASMASARLKISPEYWYESSRKPTFQIKRILVGLFLGTVFAICAFLGETISGVGIDRSITFGLRLGVVVGTGTALVASLIPFVEWWADNFPPKTMGYVGAVMFMIGFFLQSIPSLWVLLGL